MFTYRKNYKPEQCLPIDSNMNAMKVYREPQGQYQSMFNHRHIYKPEQCLPIYSTSQYSILNIQLNIQRMINIYQQPQV